MFELLIGFAFGYAAKDLNPLQMCLGIFVALVIFAVMGFALYTVWEYAPHAANLVAKVGVVPEYLIDYMRIETVKDGDFIAFILQLMKRMMICIIALLLLQIGLMMLSLMLKFAAMVVDIFIRAARSSWLKQ